MRKGKHSKVSHELDNIRFVNSEGRTGEEENAIVWKKAALFFLISLPIISGIILFVLKEQYPWYYVLIGIVASAFAAIILFYAATIVTLILTNLSLFLRKQYYSILKMYYELDGLPESVSNETTETMISSIVLAIYVFIVYFLWKLILNG